MTIAVLATTAASSTVRVSRGHASALLAWSGLWAAGCIALDRLGVSRAGLRVAALQQGHRTGQLGRQHRRRPVSSDKFHLFAAEMSLGCGLNSWFRNSVIIHATSASPLGPFIREEQVLGAFSHEPVVLTLPKEAGYVLYKIGCADNATTGSNGTWPPRLHEKPMVGRCHGCKNGVTDPSVACSHPDQVYERACQDVLFATSLDGPWQRQNLSGFERSVWPWNDVNLGLESHAPILLANGKMRPDAAARRSLSIQPMAHC